MAWDFRPGMRVVCVDDAPPPGCLWIFGDGPELGRVYTIRLVGVSGLTGKLCVMLEEHMRAPQSLAQGYWGFSVDRFRPVDETRLEIFRALLTPAPKRVQEPA